MSRVFVVSDTHFGHQGILNFGSRRNKWPNILAHDEELIENWNHVVGKRDLVWHLGDVGWGTDYYVAGIHPRLNGIKYLICGNHDTWKIIQQFDRAFGAVSKTVRGRSCLMTHIPVHPQEGDFWEYNLHGHLHDNTVKRFAWNKKTGKDAGESDPRYINCCVEHMSFTPQPLEDVVMSRSQHRSRP